MARQGRFAAACRTEALAKADRELILKSGKPAEKLRQIACGQFVFPYADDGPPAALQKPAYFPIPGLVAGDLLSPEGGAVLGPGGVLGATMPKTAIYKYRQL